MTAHDRTIISTVSSRAPPPPLDASFRSYSTESMRSPSLPSRSRFRLLYDDEANEQYEEYSTAIYDGTIISAVSSKHPPSPTLDNSCRSHSTGLARSPSLPSQSRCRLLYDGTRGDTGERRHPARRRLRDHGGAEHRGAVLLAPPEARARVLVRRRARSRRACARRRRREFGG